MSTVLFEKNKVYENVYLVFVDAAGHSSIVKNNPKDMASQAFDLLYDKIASRLQHVTTRNGFKCETAVIWSWLGDGGLIAIHDSSEQVALKTTMEFIFGILKLDLKMLQSEFRNDDILGDLHIRIAAHKGTISYTDEGQQGFIHSSDINWGAHLEKATPQDSIAVSKEIYTLVRAPYKSDFVSVGNFEEREVFIYTPDCDKKTIALNWRAAHGFAKMEQVQCYLERLSQADKAELIDSAKSTVIDFGTTLNTCSNYFDSTSRPRSYRDAVCRLLDRGGKFICYMLAPDSPGSHQLMELRSENTDEKLRITMTRFKHFVEDNPTTTSNFEVYQYEANPNFAAMVIDPELENAVCLYSPYLNIMPQSGIGAGRADMPHYLVNKRQNNLYSFVLACMSSYIKDAKKLL